MHASCNRIQGLTVQAACAGSRAKTGRTGSQAPLPAWVQAFPSPWRQRDAVYAPIDWRQAHSAKAAVGPAQQDPFQATQDAFSWTWLIPMFIGHYVAMLLASFSAGNPDFLFLSWCGRNGSDLPQLIKQVRDGKTGKAGVGNTAYIRHLLETHEMLDLRAHHGKIIFTDLGFRVGRYVCPGLVIGENDPHVDGTLRHLRCALDQVDG